MTRFKTVKSPDAEAIRALFEVSFGAPMDSRWQDWKYRVMEGFGIGLTTEKGQLIAFYAGFPRRMVTPSGSRMSEQIPELDPMLNSSTRESLSHFRTLQIGDVMVHPAHRAYFGREGPFAAVAKAFIDDQVGAFAPNAQRHFAWIYGFPNDRHLKIGQKLGLYAPVDSMWELTMPCDPTRIPDRPTMVVQRVDRDGFVTNWSAKAKPWISKQIQKLATDLGLCLNGRDAHWWVQRYLSWDAYQVFIVLSSECEVCSVDQGQLTGLFALRLHKHTQGCRAELLDIIASDGEWPSVLLEACRVAGEQSATALYCWASAPAERYLFAVAHKARLEAHSTPLPFSLAAGAWAADRLRDGFWALGGDTDFR
jgi:hypothetical protein